MADQLRLKVPKLAAFLDEAEVDVLAYMSFPKDRCIKIHSTNPIERVNGEIKRRTDVVNFFPNEEASAWSTPSWMFLRIIALYRGWKLPSVRPTA